ncbi:MAG TPA: Xaa-Pro aminopeptidase [Candidatus Syntrophosphaera sp.]|jgi:Xaa-Pro aminopeptidase|nr:Xaa-Pro aminopeptidase [Candidatus Cloacimonadota bacterium]HOR02795.1 Xaa-Pro aminopeptidase [Candidatus Syntrophosphaera sp.]HOG31208.1 Xaa-Pro aminopeptidase [Candidatus Cloacimonadota bacterium]HQG94404.1 Xaa-Pro aminopeptidase [Candidatus Syntrophosphaera sp.]HQK28919.1 Xaa-Pro aminopeptidase [Candidatus Syntrophosphaera sp.]
MTAEITAPRRERLAALLSDGEYVIVFANAQCKLQKFRQDKNFLYLTGLNHPELIYVAGKYGSRFNDMLFIERSDPERIVWEGEKLDAKEATRISGIKQVRYLDEFYPTLSGMCPLMQVIHANLGFAGLNQPPTLAMHMLQPIRDRQPQIQIKQLNDLITPLRKIKDNWEVKQLQKAIDITGQGIEDIVSSAAAGMMEYELEATLFYRMQVNGLQAWGFAPIIAAGINAATLHYEKNNCRIGDNELVLMDVGADCNGYSADVTRCFPIGKKFTARQKQIYSLVLDVQKKVIAAVKPGVKLSELNDITKKGLAQGLIALNLIDSEDQVGRYYMHSVSHFLGLDTHDLGGREAVLEEGNVITVEPGLYLPEENLGVRIEDDVLVTKTGHKVLSAKIPKEIKDIEKLRRRVTVP